MTTTARLTATVPSSPGYSGATLHLDIDPTEHARRHPAGIGPITGHGFGGLDHLMSLPAGIPVPYSDLTLHQRAYVRKAPDAIVTVTDKQVTRHAIRPCRVTLATVHAKYVGKLALDSASQFAPFCARAIVIERLHRRGEDLAPFDFYGVGVYLDTGSGTWDTLLKPRPWRPMRHTAAGWWFAERAYATYLEQIQGAAS